MVNLLKRGQAAIAADAQQALQQLLGDAAASGWTLVIAIPPGRSAAPPGGQPARVPPTVENFLRMWASGTLAVPFGLCTSEQAFELYRLTSVECASRALFSRAATSHPLIVARRLLARHRGRVAKQYRCLAPANAAAPPEDWAGSHIDWTSTQLEAFEKRLVLLRQAVRSKVTR